MSAYQVNFPSSTRSINSSSNKPPRLNITKSDLVIYTLPKQGEMVPEKKKLEAANNTRSKRLNRAYSLSLSVNTEDVFANGISKRNLMTISDSNVCATPTIASNNKTSWVFPDDDMIKTQQIQTEESHPAEENKQNAYPNGPLLVVSPNIFLYSEPTAEEILNYDLVINVAKELPNLEKTIPESSSLTYHRIPWTHTSKISPDLEKLTSIVHEAVEQNKKILIHCQCGISRSASLIVAYIMKYEEMDLNSAYDKLKISAPDISPNMGLIFQLMEWGDVLTNQGSTKNMKKLKNIE